MQARKPSLGSIRRCTLFGAAVALLVACTSELPEEVRLKSASQRKATPDFTLKDSTGATVKLSDYRGKVVLLNFWATWCGPCKVEIPWFMDFQKTYKDRDFAVLGVSMDEGGWDDVKPYIDQHKINYRVLLGNDEVSHLFGSIDSLPTTLIIDREGRIASMHLGLVAKSTYQKQIEQLLEAPRDVPKTGAVRAPGSEFALLRAN